MAGITLQVESMPTLGAVGTFIVDAVGIRESRVNALIILEEVSWNALKAFSKASIEFRADKRDDFTCLSNQIITFNAFLAFSITIYIHAVGDLNCHFHNATTFKNLVSSIAARALTIVWVMFSTQWVDSLAFPIF